jgi:hypothetical protein
MTYKLKWIAEEELPDGHRIFLSNEQPPQWAIADDSGREPQDTDDGVLWLDSSRCLILDRDESFNPPREYMGIPLIDSTGNRTRTPTDASTLLHLANKLGWLIEDQNVKAIYEVK